MCQKISRLELVRARPKISHGGLPVSSIISVYINIYIVQLRFNNIDLFKLK